LDLVAAVPAGAPVVIAPGGRAAIPTGLAFALPAGVEGQIRPRSGLALHHGVTVLNSPGTLDPDYRGEVHVILATFCRDPFPVERGAGIAQLVLVTTLQAAICEVENLDETTRGVRGFGSTGTGREGRTDYVLAAVSPISGNPMPLLPRKGALAIAAVIDI